MLKQVEGALGIKDARLNGRLVASLQDLLSTCQLESLKIGQTRVMRQIMMDYQITANKLEMELDKQWNAGLQDWYATESEAGPSRRQEVNDGCALSDQNKPDTPDLKVDEPMVSAEVSFVRLTPKVEVVKKFGCTECPLKFTTLKALKKHLKN